MKRWLLLFALASPLMAQNLRWDLPITTVQAQGGNLLPVYAIPGAGITFYTCSGSTCTSLATTYISATSGTTCPNSPTPAQVVLNGTSTCVSSADPYGNMGGWFQPGQYMVTITVGSASYNYYFTVGPGSGASGPYVPIAGGIMTGPLTTPQINHTISASDAQYCPANATIDQCINAAATAAQYLGGNLGIGTNWTVDASGFNSTKIQVGGTSYSGNNTSLTLTGISNNCSGSPCIAAGQTVLIQGGSAFASLNFTYPTVTAATTTSITTNSPGISGSGTTPTGAAITNVWPAMSNIYLPPNIALELSGQVLIECEQKHVNCINLDNAASLYAKGGTGAPTFLLGPDFDGALCSSAYCYTKFKIDSYSITNGTPQTLKLQIDASTPVDAGLATRWMTMWGMSRGDFQGQSGTATVDTGANTISIPVDRPPTTMTVTQTVAGTGSATFGYTNYSAATPVPAVNDLLTVTGTTNCGGALNVTGATITAVGVNTITVASASTCSQQVESGSGSFVVQAAATAYIQATPFGLLAPQHTDGTQEEMTVTDITFKGNYHTTTPIGPLLSVSGLFLGTVIDNVSTAFCNSDCMLGQPGTTQHISTDIVFNNLNISDLTPSTSANADHPGCEVRFDTKNQWVAGGGVANYSWNNGSLQFPSAHAPMLCVDGNGLSGSFGVNFVNSDFELGSVGTSAGSNWPDATPFQINSIGNSSFGTMTLSGGIANVAGAPTHIVEINNVLPGDVYGLSILNLRYGTASFPTVTYPIHDTALGYDPLPATLQTLWSSIPKYAPNYTGPSYIDKQVFIPLSTPPATLVEGLNYYSSVYHRPVYYDGTMFQPVAAVSDLANYLTPNAGNVLVGSAFNTSSGGVATGFGKAGCDGVIVVCTYSITTSSPPPDGLSANTQQVQITANHSLGFTSNGIVYSTPISLTAAQTSTYVWLKESGLTGATALPIFQDITTATTYCQTVDTVVLTTSWQQIPLICPANASGGTAYLRLMAQVASAGTGSIFINYPQTFATTPLNSTGPVCGSGPFGVTSTCSGGTFVQTNQANTYTAGAKQTFASSATTAGFNFAGVASDPSVPAVGDVWRNTTLKHLRFYDSGSTTQSLAEISDLTNGTLNVSAPGFTANSLANGATPTGAANNSCSQTVAASTTNEAVATFIDSGGNTTLGANVSANVTTTGGASCITWTLPAIPANATGYVWMKNSGSFGFYSTYTGTSFVQNLPATSYTAAASYPANAPQNGIFPTANTTGNVNVGNVVSWNGDAGLSRVSADVVAVGNGTPGDTSGTLYLNLIRGTTSGLGVYEPNTFSGATTGPFFVESATIGGSSGNVPIITPYSVTITQSGTAGYTVYRANVTENTLGSGPSYLFDGQVGGVSKWNVDHFGTVHQGSSAPTCTSSAADCAVATYSTNTGGEITGLTGDTSVTITFANSGWVNAAFCVATDSQASTPVYNSSQSKTAVTFSFAALTGNLFYHCDGN